MHTHRFSLILSSFFINAMVISDHMSLNSKFKSDIRNRRERIGNLLGFYGTF